MYCLLYTSNEQLKPLGNALEDALQGVTITYEETHNEEKQADLVEAFITAKRIEGCSETVSYTHLDVYKRQILFPGPSS